MSPVKSPTAPVAPKPPKAAGTGKAKAPNGPALNWTTGPNSKDAALVQIARDAAAARDGRLRVSEILSQVQAHPLFAQNHAAGAVTAPKVSARLSKLRKAGVRLPPVGRVRGGVDVASLNEGVPEDAYPQEEAAGE
jgi:hypothetical protein